MTQPFRKDPLGLSVAAAVVPGQPVTARMHIERTDVCPISGCGKTMQPILVAKDIPCYICWEHRTVLPQPNAEV